MQKAGFLPSLEMHLKFKDYQTIAGRVNLIRKEKRHISEADKKFVVPATFIYRGRNINAKVHLKGIYADHIIGKKWSFKVKTKGDDTLMGMKKFSLQNF